MWDTNCLRVAGSFTTPERVYNVAMSSAGGHSLIAAAGHDGCVRLCDIASGAFTQTLAGHRGAVWAVSWSLTAAWQLLSGGVDGQASKLPSHGPPCTGT